MDVQYLHNYSTFPDIFKHLKAVSSFFSPPLEGRVDIEEYANKLFIHAEREEAYYNGELTGLIAYYYTEGEKEAFISNVSVLPEFKNKGIASSLLSKVKLFLRDKGVCKISMEVANNSSIIDFYRKNGFDLDREIDHTKFMMVSYLHDQIPLVSILCLVYNHKDFLRKCLDGFVMQQTNFPIEILIHDDASTDGSAEIIREYEEKYSLLFKPIYQTINQYSKGVPVSGTYQYPRCSGKYIAVCEGDDYWTDPLKLQKQVDFLEANPEYGMVYTRIRRFYQKSKELKEVWGGRYETFNELLKENTIPTLSVLIVSDILIRYQKEIKPEIRKWQMGDYPLWLYVAAKSKIKFLSDTTGVYRILSISASHFKDIENRIDFGVSFQGIKLFFCNHFNLGDCDSVKFDLEWILFIKNIFEKKDYKKVRSFLMSAAKTDKKKKVKMIIVYFSFIHPLISKILYRIYKLT